ncbi:hypothetical protein J1605_023116 [Eschrichtius robustus]|uniref:Nucleophosmin n=1 Tax=Eschrichtius robustus TaxID=9764 RepID=A0AB34H8S5_ESCRO|nr:hypothetical protein J1605_023116 [Eschrichtius robustus]
MKCGSGPVHISGQHLIAVEEDPESEDEEEENVKLLSISGERSAPGSGSKVPQKKVKLAAEDEDEDEDDDDDGDDFDDEEAEEKSPVKKSVRILQPKMHKNQTRMEKPQNHQHQNQKVKNPSENRKKSLKHLKGPSSVEDIKAKMQARDTGSSPGPGSSYMTQSNEARAPQLLSLRSRACEPQLRKPVYLEPMLCNKRSHHNEKPAHRNEE